MKRKNKLYRRLSIGLVIVIILTLLVIAGGIIGNPLIKLWLKAKTESYLQTTYPQHNLTITDCRYSGRDMFSFCFTVKDAYIEDISFEISWYNNGNAINDSYPYTVANMKNTYNRLSAALADDICELLSTHSEFDNITIGAAYGDWGQEMFNGYPDSSGVSFDTIYSRENINVPICVYLTQKERQQETNFDTAVALAQKAYSILSDNGIVADYISVGLSVNHGDYYCTKGGKIHKSQLYSKNIAEDLYNEHLQDCKYCMSGKV